MILVNFKTYKQGSGESAMNLVGLIREASKNFPKTKFVACVQAINLYEAAKIFPLGVWAQHVDPVDAGQTTGWFPAESAKLGGARGTILNHSEHKLDFDILAKTLAKCREVGLETLVFAASLEEAKQVATLSPNWIGYEPPELIASKETSVAKSKPEVIESVVKAIPNIPILVGAGVKDRSDVEVSLRLGAKGVGVSSAVVLADNPRQVLENLLSGFNLLSTLQLR